MIFKSFISSLLIVGLIFPHGAIANNSGLEDFKKAETIAAELHSVSPGITLLNTQHPNIKNLILHSRQKGLAPLVFTVYFKGGMVDKILVNGEHVLQDVKNQIDISKHQNSFLSMIVNDESLRTAVLNGDKEAVSKAFQEESASLMRTLLERAAEAIVASIRKVKNANIKEMTLNATKRWLIKAFNFAALSAVVVNLSFIGIAALAEAPAAQLAAISTIVIAENMLILALRKIVLNLALDKKLREEIAIRIKNQTDRSPVMKACKSFFSALLRIRITQ